MGSVRVASAMGGMLVLLLLLLLLPAVGAARPSFEQRRQAFQTDVARVFEENRKPRRAFFIGRDGASLLEGGVDDAPREGLIVVGHPACAFTAKAAEWMRMQSSAVFDSTLWVAPADGNLSLQQLAGWNAQHAGQAFVLARSHADWPWVARWDSPQFFWMRDGKVHAHSTGWTDESQALLVRYLGR